MGLGLLGIALNHEKKIILYFYLDFVDSFPYKNKK
jgi:hypothetical protein